MKLLVEDLEGDAFRDEVCDEAGVVLAPPFSLNLEDGEGIGDQEFPGRRSLAVKGDEIPEIRMSEREDAVRVLGRESVGGDHDFRGEIASHRWPLAFGDDVIIQLNDVLVRLAGPETQFLAPEGRFPAWRA